MQAGTAAGFGDYTSFYRAYKKHFGVSPNHDKREVTHHGQVIENLENVSYLAEGFDSTLKEKKQKKSLGKKPD